MNGTKYEVHLDGYNNLDYWTGKTDKPARREFFYDGETDLMAVRVDGLNLLPAGRSAPSRHRRLLVFLSQPRTLIAVNTKRIGLGSSCVFERRSTACGADAAMLVARITSTERSQCLLLNGFAT